MQINGTAHIHGAQAVNAPHRAQAPQPTVSSYNVTGADQLDISPEATFLSQIQDVPDVRADRVADIRAAIESGVYETEEKLDLAIERLLDEIG